MRTFMIALSAALLLTSCSNPQANDLANVDAVACAITDYGNGVLYFDCTEAAFGNGLSLYKGNNPNMRVDAISGDGTIGYGSDRGYFVSVSPRD